MNIDQTKASRLTNRMHYDAGVIYSILDEALVCTINYVKDGGPRALPTGYVRIGDYLYVHGSVKSHFFQQIESADTVCITAFILDGMVLAKSGFSHSFNYRSVVLFGSPVTISESKKKEEMLIRFTDRYIPGRWEDSRKPTRQELKATSVLGFRIQEMSAKIRTGMPNDAEKDKSWPAWSGIVPLKMQFMDPEPDENTVPGTGLPAYIRNLQHSVSVKKCQANN